MQRCMEACLRVGYDGRKLSIYEFVEMGEVFAFRTDLPSMHFQDGARHVNLR